MLHSVKETKHYGFALVLQASGFLIPKKFDLTGDVTNLYPKKRFCIKDFFSKCNQTAGNFRFVQIY